MTEREKKALETTQGRFQVGMRASETIGENYAEVTGRLGWTIWISSDCRRDVAQLENKFVQFFRESVHAAKGLA